MGDTVAVLGLGCTGLACVKNLREQGFNAIGFDRNDYVGGIWQYTTNENVTSVLKSTRTNEPKYRFTFSDFEYPPELSHYPPAEEVTKYVKAYVKHNDLLKHCRLGLAIQLLERSKDGQQWDITFKDDTGDVWTEKFDRVVVCTGPQTRPLLPKNEGMEGFKGRILHSQAFKDPMPFAKQRVVVVGLSNTAGDAAVDLSKVCEEVYIAHRSGARILTRAKEGTLPIDYKFTRRISSFLQIITPWFPRFLGKLRANFLESKMRSQFPQLRDEWRLLPAPPIHNVSPVMNDNLIDLLDRGKVKSVHGIKRFLADGTSIELTNGQILESIDSVIYCTGYDFDYSFLGEGANPTAFPTPEWDQAEHAKSMPYPRLYRGMFPTNYPESLAFIGPYRGYSPSHLANCDLASAALAQIWMGNYPLPSKTEMQEWCDAHYQSMLRHVSRWRLYGFTCESGDLQRWLNDAAGNGINEKLGWGLEGWRFWWKERKLYYLLMDGVDTVFLQRLFDGRGERSREKWEKAKEAIYRANGVKLI
ncbi:hypothetical protein ABW20_dc0101573 [Dactylellina cionopaga]|nr:hypothetical protein ABW20_dc0101573 [Dactylellina cionopaga]